MNVAGTLSAQHEMLVEVIDRLGEHLAHGDRVRLRLTLEELRQALRAHLDLEDAQLYPTLLSPTSSGEEAAAALAKNFAETMAPLWRSFLELAQKHASAEAIDLEAFAAEWTPMAESLRARLAAEDNALLPLYRRVASRGGFWRQRLASRSTGTRVA